jgi:hypothetical protein
MSIMQEADLKAIYESNEISDSLLIIEDIASELTLEDICTNEEDTKDKVKQEVQFNLKIQDDIIHKAVVWRSYFSHKSLRRIKGCGRVAKHELLVLKPEYRGGRGRKIHNAEYNYYKNNGKFDEIQVDAAWSGVIVWKRIGLLYQDNNFEETLKNTFFIPYLSEIKMLGDDEINDIIEDLESNGFSEIKYEHLVTKLKLKDIIEKLPDECENSIRQHYDEIEGITDLETEVNFGLTEYLRVYSTTYQILQEFQIVPMYRRIK